MQSYYQKNKDKWNKKYLAKGYEKYKCAVCGCMISRKDKRRHERTKKHRNNMETPPRNILDEYIEQLNSLLKKNGLDVPDVSK